MTRLRCDLHDGEMTTIRAALHEKFGAVPVIDMYRQASIRCQKARDWERMRHWATRGLAVYGSDAARSEAVSDLQKRLAYAEAKLAAPTPPRRTRSAPHRAGVPGEFNERLVCSTCGEAFQRIRIRSRGRKPLRCPDCRQATA